MHLFAWLLFIASAGVAVVVAMNEWWRVWR